MINLKSKTTHDSKLFPGVTFTIKKYSAGLKHKLSLAVAALAREFNELNQELEPLRLQYVRDCEAATPDAQPTPPVELLTLINRREQITASFDHIWVKAGFVKAEGIDIDGQTLTAESLIEDADPLLYEEVRDAIKREYGLTEREKGESVPPSISVDQEGGNKTPTSADIASVKVSTDPETAPDTFPVT